MHLTEKQSESALRYNPPINIVLLESIGQKNDPLSFCYTIMVRSIYDKALPNDYLHNLIDANAQDCC